MACVHTQISKSISGHISLQEDTYLYTYICVYLQVTSIIGCYVIHSLQDCNLGRQRQVTSGCGQKGKLTCTEVMEPLLVVVMRSCRPPRSVARVGWYPTAEGIRPSRADTSELACTNSAWLCLRARAAHLAGLHHSFVSHCKKARCSL